MVRFTRFALTKCPCVPVKPQAEAGERGGRANQKIKPGSSRGNSSVRGRRFIVIAPLLLTLLAFVPASADCTNAGPVAVGDCRPTPPPSPAGQPAGQQTESASSSEAKFFKLINAERTSRGLRPLKQNAYLHNLAREHAARMARDGRIYHNYSGLQSSETHRRLGYPEMLGENVGVGPTTKWLHDEFMGSTRHRANILDSRYTGMGIGVVISDGSIWVVEDFVRDRQPVSKVARTKRGAGAANVRGGGGIAAAIQPEAAPAAAPEIVTAGPQQMVSSLMFPMLPGPGPGERDGSGRKTPPALPLAMLAMLSATALVTRKGGSAWI
jgi:uncharacterized protein YkwD